MGGWIGFGCAKHAPERFQSLILGGAHPYAEAIQGFRDGLSQGLEAFDVWTQQVFGRNMTPALSKRLLANDLSALMALSQDRLDFSSVLATMLMPCLLYVGETDPRLSPMRECMTQLADATFFSLPGCGHVDALTRSDLVLPHVKAFLAKVRQ
jgi:pimeloyl-ACP methyl ester carboxylesterase